MGPLRGKRKHWGMEDTHIFLVGAFVVSRAANKMLPAQPIGFIAMCGPWSNVFGPQCVGRGSSCGAKKKLALFKAVTYMLYFVGPFFLSFYLGRPHFLS